MYTFALALLFSSWVVKAAHNILDYGARPHKHSANDATVNADALWKALDAANAPDSTDREVLVPADYSFTMYSVDYSGLTDITLTIDGTILMSKHNLFWPTTSSKKGTLALDADIPNEKDIYNSVAFL